MCNCIQKQIEFPLLLLILLTEEVYYYENKFMFAETLKYCRFFFAEKDNSPGKTMVEGKSHGGTSLLRHHQSIAALLTFSKIQKSRHLIKSNTFPMLIVSPTDVIILMYQPQTDTLVITQVLPWEEVAYFFVWAVLHHSIFPINMPEAVECGYAKATEDFSFGDYWYLENKTVLQGNNSQAIPKFACTYRFVQDRTK